MRSTSSTLISFCSSFMAALPACTRATWPAPGAPRVYPPCIIHLAAAQAPCREQQHGGMAREGTRLPVGRLRTSSGCSWSRFPSTVVQHAVHPFRPAPPQQRALCAGSTTILKELGEGRGGEHSQFSCHSPARSVGWRERTTSSSCRIWFIMESTCCVKNFLRLRHIIACDGEHRATPRHTTRRAASPRQGQRRS